MTTTPTAKGSYQAADIAFKDLDQGGKPNGKKIMSFGATKDAFTTLSNAKIGEVYDIIMVKNDKGYWDWTKATRNYDEQTSSGNGPTPQYGANQTNKTGTTQVARSTYETPEERAKKQVYIVRQSSIASAIESLTPGAKSALKKEEVIEVAKFFEQYVFGQEVTPDSSVIETLPPEVE